MAVFPSQEKQERDRDLAELRWHWGEAYEIAFAGRVFSAFRVDGLGTLTAATASALRDAIIADYTDRPVPR